MRLKTLEYKKKVHEKLNNLFSYCREHPKKEKKPSGTCNKACLNYKACTSFTEDITPQDLEDAYTTCMEECTTRSKTTIDCMSQASIQTPGDCGKLLCATKEYEKYMPTPK